MPLVVDLTLSIIIMSPITASNVRLFLQEEAQASAINHNNGLFLRQYYRYWCYQAQIKKKNGRRTRLCILISSYSITELSALKKNKKKKRAEHIKQYNTPDAVFGS